MSDHFSLVTSVNQVLHLGLLHRHRLAIENRGKLPLDEQISIISLRSRTMSINGSVDSIVGPNCRIRVDNLEVIKILQQFDGLVSDDILYALLSLTIHNNLIYKLLDFF